MRADVSDAEAIWRVCIDSRPEVGLHFAALGATARPEDATRLVDVNALAPAHLAAALAQSGARRLVTCGSSSEYGPVARVMDESVAPWPDDRYGAAKLAGAALAHAICAEDGVEFLHLRPFSVYGPGEDPNRLVASVVAALLTGRPLDLTPGDQVRDFVYVEDVAAAFVRAASLEELPRAEVLNLGTGIETSVKALCAHLVDLTGADPGLLRFGARPYRPKERFCWRATTRRAACELGWRATTPLHDGLARTVAALREPPALKVVA